MTANRVLATSLAAALAVAGLGLALPTPAHAAATIVIVNNDGPGEGFNDPTPVAPVGGNAGTTIGQQRLNVFAFAAGIWAANLDSTVTISVLANFDPLTCTATSAVLGAAGARFIVRDFSGAGRPGTWYGEALGNKQAGVDLVPNEPDIQARFNSNLGQTGCLTGSFFYYGLDNNPPPGQVNLAPVVLHELAHGLGFQTFTNGTTGAFQSGFPSIYDYFLLDTTSNLDWTVMTNAQRVASAINTRRLVWSGANVTAAAPSVLSAGTPQLTGNAPASLAGTYLVGTASFGPLLTGGGTTGEVMPVVTQLGDTGNGCLPFNTANAVAVNGKIALMDRGVCGFAVKVKNAQDAGAIGVVMVNNVAGSPPPAMGGTDPTITIPSVMITQADGTLFKNALAFRSRTRSGVFVTMRLDLAVLSGADPLGRVLMYTPNPFQAGSSVSHWDSIAFPNLLMEPAINADLTLSVVPPQDLTRPFMLDIGW
jgi:hypothetical protein